MAPGGGGIGSTTGRGGLFSLGGFGGFVLARFLFGAGSRDIDEDEMSSLIVMIAVK